MNAIEISHTTADITVGREYMWNATGNLTFVIVDVNLDPQVWICGVQMAPYATVVWSDDNGKQSRMNLVNIVSGVRSGQIIPES